MRYLYITEQAPGNLAASIPDLPGVVATGRDREELARNLAEALAFHLHGMHEDGDVIPEPMAAPDDPELELDEGEEIGYVEPAPMNPVSLKIRQLLAESGVSAADTARRLGISRQAMYRLTNPFYYGHSLGSLNRLAEALGAKVEVDFIRPVPVDRTAHQHSRR